MTLSYDSKAQDVNPLAAFRSSYIDPETGKMCWDAVVLEIFDILKEIDPELDFSSVQQVKASYDYVGLLAEISKETGQKFLATERESGVGVAMLIPLLEKDVLAIDLAMLEQVFSENKEDMLTTLNLLHHELAHAHDAAIKRRYYEKQWADRQFDARFYWTLLPSQKLWDEYFAERRSFSTLPNGESKQIPMLEDEVPRITESVRQAIIDYRSHANVDRLLQMVFREVRFLFQLSGYALGMLAASVRTLDEVHQGAATAIRGSALHKHWDNMASHLDLMYKSHKEWPGPEIYFPLEVVVCEVLHDWGISFRTLPDGKGWVDVPFRPDTI